MSKLLRPTPAVGRKFNADGSVRAFPGNTVICFVRPSVHAGVYRACVRARDELKRMRCGGKFSFLPPESYHMTVFQLLCDEERAPEKWSRRIPLDAALGEADDFLIAAVARVERPPRFRMEYAGLRQPIAAIELKPADRDTERALRDYRDRLSEATGIRAHDHDAYRFHISLAYRIAELDAAEQDELDSVLARLDRYLRESFGVLETEAPQLTFFEDMFAFVPADQRHLLASRARGR